MTQTPFPVAILAGGLATRLRPLTQEIPKSLIEIQGEPFIFHQLRLLKRYGLQRIVMLVGYRGEMIQDAVGDGSRLGLEVLYRFDGSRLLGTAGAVKAAIPLLGDAFHVLYGDSYLECDYGRVQEAFEQTGMEGLMTVYRNADQFDPSNVQFAKGQILAYDKKHRTPEMRYIDYGLGLFRKCAFDDVPQDEPCDLTFVYQTLLRRGRLAGFEVSDRFYEIGSLQGIQDLNRFLLELKKIR